jgi:hypothetical protein
MDYSFLLVEFPAVLKRCIDITFLSMQMKRKLLKFHKNTYTILLLISLCSLIILDLVKPVNAQPTPKPTPAPKGFTMNQYGTVNWVAAYSYSDGKACIASVAIANTKSNWFVSAADQSICDLFGKAKEGDKRIFMLGERMRVADLPLAVRNYERIPADYCCLFKIAYLRIQ